MGRTKKRLASVVGLLVAVLFVFPIYWMVTTALKPANQLLSDRYDLVPLGLTVQHFIDGVTKPGFLNSLENSLILALVAVAFALVAGLLAAVPLARLRFRGRKGFLLLVLVAQMAPFEALLIPMFLMIRSFDLLNALPGLLLVYFAAALPFTAWTLRGFVKGIPVDLEEAAMVDGCGRWAAFRRVTLPLLGPGLVATSVFSFVTAWNEFLYALTFMQNTNNVTLPVWLSSFVSVFGTDWGGAMAASTVFTVPVLIFFLAVQRNLVSGVTAGAVKG
ncbi:carbohydrate ABC transporter permease [Kutzneria sp. NPDC052558]|uniref:carbohydrate ABC transporter permease n=1 Tax=Kutzneria sp. NPDC052558 TaxID=3364121 RepID=UPI0037CA117A